MKLMNLAPTLTLKLSTAILRLPLAQEEQLSVNGEIMCVKY